MKSLKTTILALLALAGANLAYGGPRAMVQAFEYGHLPGSQPGEPTVWSVEQVVGSGEWLFDKAGDYVEVTGSRSGDLNARIVHAAKGNKTKLISPVVDLSGYANAELHFWLINRNWGGDTDSLTVYYRTSSSDSWVKLKEISDAHETWTRCDIALPNLSSTYQVAFEHYDNYGYGVGIDDVEIGPALSSWTDGDGVKWTYYEEDGRAKIYNGVLSPAIDNPTTRTSVTVPAKLDGMDADIEEAAFHGCDALASVTIPGSVKSIGNGAFSACKSLATIYVEAGDTARVKGLVEGAGFNGDVTYVEPAIIEPAIIESAIIEPDPIDPAIWYTTRAEAMAEARRAGKKVFMVCGRDSCGNTMFTKNVSCEDPSVKPTLAAKCVLWYSNCDTQEDENWDYWPNGTFSLPVVCLIDPSDSRGYIVRVTGPQTAADILALLELIPYPDPDTGDPLNPGDLACYKVINAKDIWDPIRTSKAETLHGVVYRGCDVVGVVELKIGKVNAKKQTTKISGSVTLLDGKKHAIKSATVSVGSGMAISVYLEVKGLDDGMRLAVGSVGGANVFAGALGRWHVQSSAGVGGGWPKASATASVEIGSLSLFPGKVLTGLLPTNEVASVSGGKWSFAKAASVKWAKPKAGAPLPEIYDAASGKGLVIDTSGGKTNLSGLKLSYTPKKGVFKGSFKIYTLEGTKLRKFTVKVNGVVVDGVGYGEATSKKPYLVWPVSVR